MKVTFLKHKLDNSFKSRFADLLHKYAHIFDLLLVSITALNSLHLPKKLSEILCVLLFRHFLRTRKDVVDASPIYSELLSCSLFNSHTSDPVK